MFRIEVLRRGQWTDNVSQNDEEWTASTYLEALEMVKGLPNDGDWVGIYRIEEIEEGLSSEVGRFIHAVKPHFTPTLPRSELKASAWYTPLMDLGQHYLPEYAFIDGLLVKRIKEGPRVVDYQVTFLPEGIEPWNDRPNIHEKYWVTLKIEED